MKNRLLVLLLGMTLPLYAASTSIHPTVSDLPQVSDAAIKANQLTMLDHLISVTQQNLEIQKQLRKEVQDYLEVQNIYLQNTHDRNLTMQMVMKAHHLLEKIKEAHLTQGFDPEFMSELTFFSQIATKRGIPSPQ